MDGNNDYQIGDWGVTTFTRKKYGLQGKITAFGQIKAIERKVILFEDDCIEYLIDRKEFIFEKKPAPVNK